MTVTSGTADVEHATEDDLRVAIRRATERTGFTYAQLTDQARRNDFETVSARMAWVAIGGLDGILQV